MTHEEKLVEMVLAIINDRIEVEYVKNITIVTLTTTTSLSFRAITRVTVKDIHLPSQWVVRDNYNTVIRLNEMVMNMLNVKVNSFK